MPENAPETPAADAPVPESAGTAEPREKPAPEVDWKAEARKWEQRAKDNKKALDEARPVLDQWKALEEASKTELQRAQEAAQTAEERARATLQRVAAAEVKAALTGVVPDPAALLEDLNIARFVTPEGDVNAEAIGTLRDKYAALAPAPTPRMAPNPAQGTSTQPPLSVHERIAQAQQAGDIKTAMRLKAQLAIGTNQ